MPELFPSQYVFYSPVITTNITSTTTTYHHIIVPSNSSSCYFYTPRTSTFLSPSMLPTANTLIQRVPVPARQIQRRTNTGKPKPDKPDIKAETLLLKTLEREQRKTWLANEYFDFTSQFGRRYRIKRGRIGNVFRLDKDGKQIATFCCHPNITVPVADCVMAQYMTLRFNEAAFLAETNIHWMAPGYTTQMLRDVLTPVIRPNGQQQTL